MFRKDAANVSSYYFKELKERGIIEQKEKVGKKIYWGLARDYEPLKFFIASQKAVQQAISIQVGQSSLFG